jgi:SAM-dependent methyltransferase
MRPYSKSDLQYFGAHAAMKNAGTLDLERQPRLLAGCELCGSTHAQVICSAEDIASQQRFLESFYRSRWSKQDAASATDRVTFTQDYATAVVACKGCGLLYRNPRPLGQAVTKAYETEHYENDYLMAELKAQRAWARTKVPLVARYLRTARRSRPRVLEVGSFVGGFLLEAQKQGWDMVGVDPGRDVAAFCRERGLPIFEGTLEDAGFPPASFDAVVVWNTFEQLPDPRLMLEQAVALLRNGGLLVVRVPNGACFARMLRLRALVPPGLRRAFDIALAHNNLLTFPYLYGYSAAQLERLTASYGFRLAACVPDQVVSTPPGHLAWRGAVEERMVRALFQCLTTVWQDHRSRQYRTAPWLDCVFVRGCTEDDRTHPKIGLGVIPVYSPLVFEDTELKTPMNR